MNETQANKVIELLEEIRDLHKATLDEQRKQDEEISAAMKNLPFGQEESEEKKSTESFFNQKLVKEGFAASSPWS